MGLGKTIQVIAFLAAVLGKKGNNSDKAAVRMKRRGEMPGSAAAPGPILIVCPSSVHTQWYEQLQKWGHFSLASLQGSNEDKAQAIERTKQGRVEVLLTSYDMLRRHEKALSPCKWEVVVFDEFHLLKNPKSAGTRSARALSADFRIGLTGTPIQNNLEELWCLLSVLSPGRFLDMKEWKAHFSNPIKRAQKKSASAEAVERGKERQRELQKLLHSHMLRRTKEVIEHELKGKDDIIVFCELTELQVQIYKHLLSLPDFRNARFYRKNRKCKCSPQPCKHKIPLLPDESGLDERAVLWLRAHKEEPEEGCPRCPTCITFSCLGTLQKVANHPFLLQVDELDPDSEKRANIEEFARKALGPELLARLGGPIRSQRFTEISRADVSGKMETLTKLLHRFHSKGDKVLLFSFSTQMLDLLQAYVKSKGYSHLRLDGRTPTAKRQQLIDQFNQTNSLFLFLISTKAGGLGLNLTSANKVIVFDVNWNPSYDLQAQDRAFRIGQMRHVQVFRLVSQGTVEELCYMRQVYKQQLTRAAMDKAAKGSTPRHFEGVQGEEHGELFGVENLMQFMDGSILKAIRSSVGSNGAASANNGEVMEEQQISIEETMRKAVGKALEDVKTGSQFSQENPTDSELLEDPATLLAALGVVGTNMAADEMLYDKHTRQETDEEDDDEPESFIESSEPTPVEVQQTPPKEHEDSTQEPSENTREFLRSLEDLAAREASEEAKQDALMPPPLG